MALADYRGIVMVAGQDPYFYIIIIIATPEVSNGRFGRRFQRA